MNLPEEFSQKVKRVWGEEGERWVSRFPDALAACTANWGLADLAPFPNLSYNFIASARTTSGQAVILKMGVPNPELACEVSALQAYNGRGCIKLLAYDADNSALLLEQLIPGTELHQLGDNKQESRIAAQVMAQLCVPPSPDHSFPTLLDWTKAFERVPAAYRVEDYGLPPGMVETAGRLAEELSRTASQECLLHGDMHHFNILHDRRRGWTAIDPKGVVGDKAYQAARFLCNPIPDFLTYPDPVAVTRQRAEIIAAGLELDPQRILKWAFVDCLLGASWCIEETDRQGVRYFIECARIISESSKIQPNRW